MSEQRVSDEANRRDQLTSAPESTEDDAAPRIEVTEHDGRTRIDVREDAQIRPGPGPGAEEADGSLSDDSRQDDSR